MEMSAVDIAVAGTAVLVVAADASAVAPDMGMQILLSFSGRRGTATDQ